MINKLTIVINNLIKLKNFSEVLSKIQNKFEKNTKKESIDWAKSNLTSIETFCSSKDKILWEKCQKEYQEIEKKIKLKLKDEPDIILSGGILPLIYFLVLLNKPKNIFETGVAYGFSTEVILSAIQKNQIGHLFSSDLPYYKIRSPKKIVGKIVSMDLKKNWTLDLRGDHISLNNFLTYINKVDFLHYDSDKSYNGRKKTIKKILKYLTASATLIMDDIQDNIFFKNFVEQNKLKYHVFHYQEKYVGLIENIGLQINHTKKEIEF